MTIAVMNCAVVSAGLDDETRTAPQRGLGDAGPACSVSVLASPRRGPRQELWMSQERILMTWTRRREKVVAEMSCCVVAVLVSPVVGV